MSISTVSASLAQLVPEARKFIVDSLKEMTSFALSPMRLRIRSKYDPASEGGTWDKTEYEMMKSGLSSVVILKLSSEMM